jgi:predicted RNA-binding protein YlqC (UPF0109 family)
MLEILKYLVSCILPDGSSFEINQETNEENETVFNIIMPQELRGHIIGKSGITINSIRDLISIIARRENKKVYIKVID